MSYLLICLYQYVIAHCNMFIAYIQSVVVYYVIYYGTYETRRRMDPTSFGKEANDMTK